MWKHFRILLAPAALQQQTWHVRSGASDAIAAWKMLGKVSWQWTLGRSFTKLDCYNFPLIQAGESTIYIYIQNLIPTCATRNSTLVTFPLGALQLCYGTAKMSELNTGSGSEDPRSWSRQMNMQWLHSPKFLNSQRPNSSKNEPNSEANQQLFLRPHFHWLMLVDRDPHP